MEFYTPGVGLNINRLEELLDGRLGKAIGSHQRVEPLALGAASIRVIAHNLGVVVIDLPGRCGGDGSSARLVTGVVVQANLAKSRADHLVFKGSQSLKLG